MNTYRIVVGVDGSDGSDRALRWAAREAQHRGGTIHVVMAWTWDSVEASMVAASHPAEEQARAARTLARAIGAVAAEYPEIPLSSEVIEGPPARVMARAAADADVLVLGSHGHGRIYHAVLGSVTEACIRAADCPVVVVPTPHDEHAPKPAEVHASR